MNRGDIPALLDTYADDGYCLTMGRTLISGKFSKKQIRAAAGAIFEVFPKGMCQKRSVVNVRFKDVQWRGGLVSDWCWTNVSCAMIASYILQTHHKSLEAFP